MKQAVLIVLALCLGIASAQILKIDPLVRVGDLPNDDNRHADGDADEIIDLPRVNGHIPYKQYAGYVTVNETMHRELFYWLEESQSSPSTDPLVIWLNGGPGCSSLGGKLTEQGGTMANENIGLDLNPNAWNKIANMLFIESPANVGFSKSGQSGVYTTGDHQTALDLVAFIKGFLVKHPRFVGRKLFITGESYGGHYVPTAAQAMVQAGIKVEAIAVGNGWMDANVDNRGAVSCWVGHQLIAQDTFQGMMDNCDFSNIGPLEMNANAANCTQYTNKAMTEMGNINIYNMYGDICLSSLDNQATTLIKNLAPHSALHSMMAKRIEMQEQQMAGSPFGSCIGAWAQKYLNLPEVQKAIHADISYPWTDCAPGSRLSYSYHDLLQSVQPVYEWLHQNNVRILVYSGDVDAIVPTPGSLENVADITKNLGLSVKQPWTSWYDEKKQVGGRSVVYEGDFVFTTVRGAGHLVPQIQPERGLQMFKAFINNTPF